MRATFPLSFPIVTADAVDIMEEVRMRMRHRQLLLKKEETTTELHNITDKRRMHICVFFLKQGSTTGHTWQIFISHENSTLINTRKSKIQLRLIWCPSQLAQFCVTLTLASIYDKESNERFES